MKCFEHIRLVSEILANPGDGWFGGFIRRMAQTTAITEMQRRKDSEPYIWTRAMSASRSARTEQKAREHSLSITTPSGNCDA